LLKKSSNTSKSFGFVPKFLEKIEKFCFCKKEVGTHQKVLVFSKMFGINYETFHFRFWNTSKRFGFVSILSFNIGMFVLSFLSVSESGSGSTLPDLDPLVRGMDPDPNPSMTLLQKSESVCSGT
jgi:hypothetical protein